MNKAAGKLPLIRLLSASWTVRIVQLAHTSGIVPTKSFWFKSRRAVAGGHVVGTVAEIELFAMYNCSDDIPEGNAPKNESKKSPDSWLLAASRMGDTGGRSAYESSVEGIGPVRRLLVKFIVREPSVRSETTDREADSDSEPSCSVWLRLEPEGVVNSVDGIVPSSWLLSRRIARKERVTLASKLPVKKVDGIEPDNALFDSSSVMEGESAVADHVGRKLGGREPESLLFAIFNEKEVFNSEIPRRNVAGIDPSNSLDDKSMMKPLVTVVPRNPDEGKRSDGRLPLSWLLFTRREKDFSDPKRWNQAPGRGPLSELDDKSMITLVTELSITKDENRLPGSVPVRLLPDTSK